MSVESFRGRPDAIQVIIERNVYDRAYKRAFSPTVSLALQLKEEGTTELRFNRIRDEGVDRALNYGAILLGISMVVIETALKEGIYDSRQVVALYNEAVIGTNFSLIDEPPEAVEIIREDQLRKIREFASLDKKLTIFFTDEEAYKSLPGGLIALIESKKGKGVLRKAAEVHLALTDLLPKPGTKLKPVTSEPFNFIPEDKVDKIIKNFALHFNDTKS